VFVDAEFANDGNGGGFLFYGPLSGTHRTEEVGYEAISTPASLGAGRSIAVGDLDGDGFADVAVGAPYMDKLLIEPGPIQGDFDLADASIQMSGGSSTFFGHGSAIADVGGDSSPDLVVGAYATWSGAEQSGSVYADFGPLSAAAPIDGHDVELYGSTSGFCAGRVVKAGADMDGDGTGDLLIEATEYPDGVPLGGIALVVHGPLIFDRNLDDADATLVGVVPRAVAGAGLAQGDVDGDGLADALVGAPLESPTKAGSSWYDGAAYVVSGSATGTIELDDADVIVHGTSGGGVGTALASGDLDGDGQPELFVGAPSDADYAGATLVFFDAMPGTWDDTDAAARLIGEVRSDLSGTALLVTDLDGNGRDDLLLGAPAEATGNRAAGALYVIDPF
jgi:hypothetical protein